MKPAYCSLNACSKSVLLDLMLNMGLITQKSLDNPKALVDKALVKADEVFGSQDFRRLEEEVEDSFRDLVESFIKDDDLTVKSHYFNQVRKEYYSERKVLFEPATLLLGV